MVSCMACGLACSGYYVLTAVSLLISVSNHVAIVLGFPSHISRSQGVW